MKKKALLVGAVFLSTCVTSLPAYAESDPFELPHPVTGEPGVWIPPWAQRLSLETNAKLKTCSNNLLLKTQLVVEREAEIASRIEAQQNLEAALQNTQLQLVTEQERVKEAEKASESRLVWALISTGGALVSGVILAIVAAN